MANIKSWRDAETASSREPLKLRGNLSAQPVYVLPLIFDKSIQIWSPAAHRRNTFVASVWLITRISISSCVSFDKVPPCVQLSPSPRADVVAVNLTV